MGGHTPDTSWGSGGRQNIIQFVTIASTGNAAEFGDMTVYAQGSQACASPTRAVRGAGAGNPANQQVIDYVTIATRGDAIHFGELDDIKSITLKLNKWLEGKIFLNPDQWIWTHNKWKL